LFVIFSRSSNASTDIENLLARFLAQLAFPENPPYCRKAYSDSEMDPESESADNQDDHGRRPRAMIFLPLLDRRKERELG
jgi:hypothetical protein